MKCSSEESGVGRNERGDYEDVCFGCSEEERVGVGVVREKG